MFKKTIAFLFTGALLAVPLAGQETKKPEPEQKFFRLDFVVKELEGGKVVNSRSYNTVIATVPPFSDASIRTGNRVPVPVEKGTTGNAVISGYSYMDVGVNIDCRQTREVGGQLVLLLSADISSIVSAENAGVPPVVRNNRWNGPVLLVPRKPAIAFSSDDPSTKRQMQLEVTATPIP